MDRESLLSKILGNLKSKEQEIARSMDLSKTAEDVVSDLESKGLIDLSVGEQDDSEVQKDQ